MSTIETNGFLTWVEVCFDGKAINDAETSKIKSSLGFCSFKFDIYALIVKLIGVF